MAHFGKRIGQLMGLGTPGTSQRERDAKRWAQRQEADQEFRARCQAHLYRPRMWL